MVALCEKCSTHCISWAKNKQSCKCGSIKGFQILDGMINISVSEDSQVSIWFPTLQKYVKYEKDDQYDSTFWSGYSGEKFAI